MAVLVPCGIGVLIGLCVAHLLPADGAASLRVPAPGTAPRSPLDALCRVARGIGDALARWGVGSGASPSPMLDELRQLTFSGGRPLAEVDDRTARGLVVLACLLAAGVALIVSTSPLAVPVGFALPVGALAVSSVRRRRQDARRLEEAMPEAFGSLAVSLGSGHSLPQAMRYVGSHAEEPVRSEFMRVSFAVDCGIAAIEALDAMLDRLHAPGLDLVVLALNFSQRTGAPLKDLLAEATRMVTEHIELKRTLDVKTSQARMSARLVASMPMAMIALLSLLSGDFRTGLATPAGAISVAVGLVLDVTALLVIRNIMKVEL